MARYEHLPIFREAYDLTVHVENLVRSFSRYHKYTLGTDLRNKTRGVLELIVEANNSRDDRAERLEELRRALENLKVLNRLCHDAKAFPGGTRSYLHMAERITNLARQNEGWIRSTRQAQAR
jgi:N-glycosylase/DNA lyase